MPQIAIIGAGLAGLSVARDLVAAGRRVQVFDKGRGLGGRLATRRLTHAGAEHRFDHGAQYLRASGASFAALLDAAGAAPWPDGDRRVPRPGISALARHMGQGLDIATATEVTALRRDDSGWHLEHQSGLAGPFAAVLVTIPAPQAIPIFAPHAPMLAARLGAIRYAPCWTVLAAFAARLDRPDTLRHAAPIGWAARDSAKPGRDAAQENWVVQADPEFSRAHLEATPESVIAPLLDALAPHRPPALFAQAHRWRYALVEAALEEPCLWDAAEGLGYASDGCIAGRAEAAFDSGRALAARVLEDRVLAA